MPSDKPQSFATVITAQTNIELTVQTSGLWRHARLKYEAAQLRITYVSQQWYTATHPKTQYLDLVVKANKWA